MRRRAAPKRDITPDPMYRSQVVAKFTNYLMLEGKKSVAQSIVYDALAILAAKAPKVDSEAEGGEGGEGGQRALVLFEKVLDTIRPYVEVKSRRVGGATYQVPVEVKPNRQMALAMRWLTEFSRKRNEKTMVDRLANEMLDILQGRGGTLKRRSDVHQMAKANQAFAHLNWQK